MHSSADHSPGAGATRSASPASATSSANERRRLRLDLGRVVVTERREQRLPIGIGRENRIRRIAKALSSVSYRARPVRRGLPRPEPQSSDDAPNGRGPVGRMVPGTSRGGAPRTARAKGATAFVAAGRGWQGGVRAAEASRLTGCVSAQRRRQRSPASSRRDGRPSQTGSGGDEGTRTPDPRDANAVLSQLSYIPTERSRRGAADRWQSVAEAIPSPADRTGPASPPRPPTLRRCRSDSTTA